MDAYGVQSQLRATTGTVKGKFADEIVPMTVAMGAIDKVTGAAMTKEVTVSSDEGIRPNTTLEGVSKMAQQYPAA